MTSFGINNEGQLVFDYFHSDTDQLEGANVYNGQNSVLWCNFRDAFPDEIKATYQDLRSNGVLNYDELVEQFITKGSDKWSESIYNEDADFKYISMLYEDGDASNLSQVRGTGEEHFRYFVENRLNYCDGKWYAPAYADDYVALRIYTPETWAGVEPNADITVTPFSHMYAGVRYKANGTLYQKRVSANEVTTFEAPNETFNDTETAIYGASQLSSLGDLSPLYCGTINVSKATKLTELIIGSDVEGYANPNLLDLSVGTNNLLKVLNVRNCPNLTDPLALSGCPNIEEIYAAGSGITGVELADSGYLKTIELPATITNLTLKNQLYIESLTLEGYGVIKTINIENCPTVASLDILSAATNVERVRLTNVDWAYDTVEDVLALSERNLAGIDENGNNTDKMWIDGKCHIKALTGADYLKIKEAFPYMTITYDNLTAKLTYMSEDGSEKLHEETIYNGGDGAYAETNFTKPSTAQYDFTFGGWSLSPNGEPNENALKNVEADRTVYVAFAKELRSYTVRFYNGTTLLRTLTVQYGGDAVYSGSTPVNNSTGNPDDFEFYGWKPAPTNIQGETNCYAQFYDKREITDSWATIAANVKNGTATEKYAIGAFKTLDIGEVSLPYDFNQGSAVVYNGEIHILGSAISEYRTSHYKFNGTKWDEVGTIPYEFYYGSAVVFNDEIHILGGSSSSSGRTKHYKWNGSNWASVSTLPYTFDKGVAIVYDNEIHIMGSRDSSNYTSHYKWNGSAWSEVGELPYSFYTASGFIYNNEIHVLGSYDSKYETAHYKYDGSSWTSVSTLPQKLSNGHALAVGTDIYMIQWDEFYKYDGTSWHTCSDVPANVYDGRSVVLDGNIYVMGSSVSENEKVFYSYTPETSTWSKVGITESIPMEIIAHNHDELPDGVMKWKNIDTPLPITQQYGCAVTLNNEVHVLGGNNATTYTQHLKWDATNSSWVTVSTLPYQLRSGCAVVLNDEIHILGSYQTTNKTEHYKWNGTEWTSVSTLPYAFYCASAVVLNGEIHILGSYYSSNRKSHYKWNGTEWVSVSTLSYNFYYGSAIVYGDEIHIFGGSGASTGHYKWNETNGWTEVSTLPYDLSSGAAGVLNNEIHIFGGSDAETAHYKWNGTEWVSVSTLPDDFYNSPLTICNNTPYIFIGMTCYTLVGAGFVDLLPDLPSNTARNFTNELFVFNDTLYRRYSKVIYEYDDDVTNTDVFGAVVLGTINGSIGRHAILNGELHYISTESSSADGVHQKYDESTGAFIEASTLPDGINEYGCEFITYKNEIYFFSGNKNFYHKYDGSTWSGPYTSPKTFYHGRGIVYNDELHIIFGTGANVIQHYKFDGSNWTSVCTTPVTFNNVNLVVYNDEIHALGGGSFTDKWYKFNGSEWVDTGNAFSISTTGNGNYTSQACVYRGKLYVAGVNLAAGRTVARLENPKASLTFLAKNLLKDNRQFHSVSNRNIYWSMSDLRAWCNGDFYEALPEDLQTAISEVIKVSDTGYTNQSLENVNDKVWVPSVEELGYEFENHILGQGSVYSVFTDNDSRKRTKLDGTIGDYWTRTVNLNNAGFFVVYGTNGVCTSSATNNAHATYICVLPGFCI